MAPVNTEIIVYHNFISSGDSANACHNKSELNKSQRINSTQTHFPLNIPIHIHRKLKVINRFHSIPYELPSYFFSSLSLSSYSFSCFSFFLGPHPFYLAMFLSITFHSISLMNTHTRKSEKLQWPLITK